jgi:hypothetical protein
MSFRLILRVVGVLSIGAILSCARADWHHSLGRHLGVGWGDGYHSRTACPPRRSPGYFGSQPSPPWWATPAAEAEPLPHPAAPPKPDSAQPFPAGGPSLFRQPGEDSSVIISSGPASMR